MFSKLRLKMLMKFLCMFYVNYGKVTYYTYVADILWHFSCCIKSKTHQVSTTGVTVLSKSVMQEVAQKCFKIRLVLHLLTSSQT